MSLMHKLLFNVLFVFIALHVAAAIWHDLAHRAGLHARMLALWPKRHESSGR
jgi:cytochrome b